VWSVCWLGLVWSWSERASECLPALRPVHAATARVKRLNDEAAGQLSHDSKAPRGLLGVSGSVATVGIGLGNGIGMGDWTVDMRWMPAFKERHSRQVYDGAIQSWERG